MIGDESDSPTTYAQLPGHQSGCVRSFSAAKPNKNTRPHIDGAVGLEEGVRKW